MKEFEYGVGVCPDMNLNGCITAEQAAKLRKLVKNLQLAEGSCFAHSELGTGESYSKAQAHLAKAEIKLNNYIAKLAGEL